MKKYFIITVDTEGDNMWRQLFSQRDMRKITIRNGEYLLPFQELCEKYNFIPTYLVNYEMSKSSPLIKMADNKKDKLEIGMHFHAWNTPPIYDLKINPRYTGNPYAGEYPVHVLEKKIEYLTKSLEDRFQRSITSHRGGRWYIDDIYIKTLQKYGYLVDCSVTPGVSWKKHEGVTTGSKGVDFRKYPNFAYEMSANSIAKRGKSGMFEVPVTVDSKKEDNWLGLRKKEIWLRPNRNNLQDMLWLVNKKDNENCKYLEFMIHSSELMPHGSPVFIDASSIKKLYLDMDKLFSFIKEKGYEGVALSNYVKENKLLSNGKSLKPHC